MWTGLLNTLKSTQTVLNSLPNSFQHLESFQVCLSSTIVSCMERLGCVS